jgi:hypothetical protein
MSTPEVGIDPMPTNPSDTYFLVSSNFFCVFKHLFGEMKLTIFAFFYITVSQIIYRNITTVIWAS